MPKKPVHFGLNVWVAADALSKYVWNFQIYCRRSENPHDEGSKNSASGEEENSIPKFPKHSGPGKGL